MMWNRAYVISMAAACMALTASTGARAQERRDVVSPAPVLSDPERGMVASALARLTMGPGDLERGTFALPAPLAASRVDGMSRRIDRRYGCEPLCAPP